PKTKKTEFQATKGDRHERHHRQPPAACRPVQDRQQDRLPRRAHAVLPELTLEQSQTWVMAHRPQTGKWSTARSGPVAEASGETWRDIEMALFQGHRGWTKGSSLAPLLKPLKERSS